MVNNNSKKDVSSLVSPDILKNLNNSQSPKAFGDQLNNPLTSNILEAASSSPIGELLKEKEELISEGILLEIEHQTTLLKLKTLNTPSKKIVNGQTVDVPPKLSNEEYEISVKNENINYEIAKKIFKIKRRKMMMI